MLWIGILIAGWATGCAAEPPTPPVTHSFVCALSVAGQEQTFDGTLTVEQNGLTWALSAPETLAGCTVTADGQTVRLSVPEGEALTTELGVLPQAGILPVLWDVLAAEQPTAADGQLTGEVSGGVYVLQYDPETGYLQKLTLKGGGWEATFSAVREY